MSEHQGDDVHPTAFISWAHEDAGWSTGQIERRRNDVTRLAQALRNLGIDVDLDAFHTGDVDWTRWGPQQVNTVDYVLIVASNAWADAWHGSGNVSRNLGAAAEADAIQSREGKEGRGSLTRFCRVLMLPGSTRDAIPDRLHGAERYSLETFTPEELEPLLRDLTKQPALVKAKLGELPVFPPNTSFDQDEPSPSTDPKSPPGNDLGQRSDHGLADGNVGDRVEHLHALINALPTPQPGEGPHLPWFRTWSQAVAELATLEGRVDDESDTPPEPPEAGTDEAPWAPISPDDVHVPWTPDQPLLATHSYACVVVHVIPVPPATVTQRQRANLADTLADRIRSVRVVPATVGLELVDDAHQTVLSADSSTAYGHVPGSVTPAQFGGVRVLAGGIVSVWFTLPRDSMGPVLDAESIGQSLETSLGLAANVLGGLGPASVRVAVAAEVSNHRSITDGNAAHLGHRSSVSLIGALRPVGPRVEAEESLPLTFIRTESGQVVSTVVRLLLRGWTN